MLALYGLTNPLVLGMLLLEANSSLYISLERSIEADIRPELNLICVTISILSRV
jgi:hypothetical protein